MDAFVNVFVDEVVESEGLCLRAPRLVWIDEHHNLKCNRWIVDFFWEWKTLRAVSLSKTSILLVYELSSPVHFSSPCVRSRELVLSFLNNSGSRWLSLEGIAMKTQSRSPAVQTSKKDCWYDYQFEVCSPMGVPCYPQVASLNITTIEEFCRCWKSCLG